MSRPDRLTGVRLAAHPELPRAQLCASFAQPDSAIALLAQDLTLLWDRHRSDDFGERRIGTLQLASRAYVQWIGYEDALAVEVSSNTYLSGDSRLTPAEEATLLRAGFQAPDDGEPNFWLAVEDRSACPAAALAVVAALTAVFGVYAG